MIPHNIERVVMAAPPGHHNDNPEEAMIKLRDILIMNGRYPIKLITNYQTVKQIVGIPPPGVRIYGVLMVIVFEKFFEE